MHLTEEVNFYLKAPALLRRHKKSIVKIHGQEGYDIILTEVKAAVRRERLRKSFAYYRSEVNRITEQQPWHTLINSELRGFKAWHIDHIKSVYEGFRTGIPPEIIGHIDNLQMLTHTDNIKKGRRRFGKCSEKQG